MKHSGKADLPLHYGKVPPWLYERMTLMAGAISEAIVTEYGQNALLSKLSDPFWFQAFGAVLGMDWHSSGITTSVLGALRKAINPMSGDLGIYVCGGRGKHSLKTPEQLLSVADRTGIDGQQLVRNSKLVAKVDNTAIQDGFSLYLHTFIVTDKAEWTVVQQGMNDATGYARRYHWHSANVKSFVDEPHSAICGMNQGKILNLTAHDAKPTREGIMDITFERSAGLDREMRKILLPSHHEVRYTDLDLKRLGAVLELAYHHQPEQFDDLLLIKGLGPKTIRALTLVSEVIHGTPSRFDDPARFSFSFGGKDGHPFPVQTHVYDESITQLKRAVEKARLGITDKNKAIKKLSEMAQRMEYAISPEPDKYTGYIEKEKLEGKLYGGRTVFDKKQKPPDAQLKLF